MTAANRSVPAKGGRRRGRTRPRPSSGTAASPLRTDSLRVAPPATVSGPVAASAGGTTITTPSLARRAASTAQSSTAGRRGPRTASGRPNRCPVPPATTTVQTSPRSPADTGHNGSTVAPAMAHEDLLAKSDFFAGSRSAKPCSGSRPRLPNASSSAATCSSTRATIPTPCTSSSAAASRSPTSRSTSARASTR